MHLMTPPLNPIERAAATAAARAALDKSKHAGIRPAGRFPNNKSPGVRIKDIGTTDDAIEAARHTWPRQREFAVFGADTFEPTTGIPPQFNADQSPPNNDDDEPWGDGAFTNVSDLGSFQAPPGVDVEARDGSDW